MSRRSRTAPSPVSDYRHDARRKNNPPAGLAGQGRVQETPKLTYSYDPHRPPILRSDDSGESDRAGELLGVARERALSADEVRELSALLRNREPWLEWVGTREAKGFVVDPMALHIHERVSTQAILKAVRIARALKGSVDEDAFEALSGTESLPFTPGRSGRVAVKVIDPRGNEVMRIHRLEASGYGTS